MTATELIIDMDNPREKFAILEKIRGLTGMIRLSACKYAKRRTDRQNRYYHPCFVQPFADFLRGQGSAISDDDAHKILKRMFLTRSTRDPRTGGMLEYVQSTTTLTTIEFNEYMDSVAAFLLDYAGIAVPDPSIYRENS